MKNLNKLATIGLLTMLTACTEEISESRQTDGALTFCVEVADTTGNATLTRSIATLNSQEPQKVTASNGRTLYLHQFAEPRKTDISKTTRGTLIGENNMTDFGVSGYKHDKSTALSNETANFFHNGHVQQVNTNTWTMTDKSYYIPTTNEVVDFYAYYPYSSNDVVIDDANDEGPMTIHYTVNTTMSNQQDLLTAVTPNQTYSKTAAVPVRFSHALTAIRFVLSDEVTPGYIKNVAIEEIALAGSYQVGKKWTMTNFGTFSVDFTSNGTTTGLNTQNGSTALVGSTTDMLLMIPQAFTSDDQQMTINIATEDGAEYTIHAPLKGTTWTAGTMITYAVSTSSANFINAAVSYPASWGTDAFSIKNGFAANDDLGLFAVDGNGKVVKANVHYIYDGTKWAPEYVSQKMNYKPGYTYYAYHPYHSALNGAKTEGTSFTGSTAREFFADVMDGWPVTDDQSTTDKLLACDLQIGKAEAAADGIFTHISLPMEHAFGLAKLTLDSRNIPNILYYLSTDNSYTWADYYHTVTASNQFSSAAIPCPITTSKNNEYSSIYDLYYYIRKESAGDVTFSATPTGTDNARNDWRSDVTCSITNGAASTGTALLPEDCWAMTAEYKVSRTSYTMAVGHVYFSDGAIGTKANSYATDTHKKPIGLIYKVGAAGDGSGKTHGTVVAARCVGGNSRTWVWATTTAETGNGTLSYNYNTVYSVVGGDRAGYTKTHQIVDNPNYNATLFPAVFAAVNHGTITNQPAPARSSGWYLPAIGQHNDWLRAFSSTVNGISHNTGTTWTGSDNIVCGFAYNSTQSSHQYATKARDQINKKFTDAGFATSGTYIYDNIDYANKTRQCTFWSVSEYKDKASVFKFRIGSGSSDNQNIHFERQSPRTFASRVRPFLSF